MSRARWNFPLDPECPPVEKFDEMMATDPMVAYSGCEEEIREGFEARHRSSCDRCQEYGAANVEVLT